jgi:FKBP-type peptidyl-prolyl cis-trans isomerase FkpA
MKSVIALIAASAIASSAFAASAPEKLPSGVVVETIKQGTGPAPAATDVVKVNYRGTLKDGTVFDASDKHGGPASFPLNRVIPCWTEGVQKMKVGGKAKLTCPAATAYGDRGVGPIPPNSDLTFEIELLGIGQ